MTVPLEQFIITKGLTKAPEDYPDGKSLPHVQVAKRMLGKVSVMILTHHLNAFYMVCRTSLFMSVYASRLSSVSILRRIHSPTVPIIRMKSSVDSDKLISIFLCPLSFSLFSILTMMP